MEPGAAIASAFKRYFDFSTRSSRSEFWWFVLFNIVVSIIAGLVDTTLGFVPTNALDSGPLESIWSLIVFIPSLSVSVRRLHDIDKSGWFYLLIFLILIGWIVLLIWFCTKGTHGPNRFGDDPLDPTGDVGEVFN